MLEDNQQMSLSHLIKFNVCGYEQLLLNYCNIIYVVERWYWEISQDSVHYHVLLLVWSMSNNAKCNKRVMFPRYHRSTVAIRYYSVLEVIISSSSGLTEKGLISFRSDSCHFRNRTIIIATNTFTIKRGTALNQTLIVGFSNNESWP